MRDLDIAPDVAAIIGPAREKAIRAGRELASGRCPVCRGHVDRQHQDAAVVIRAAIVDGQRTAYVNLTHAPCSRSRIIEVSAAQVEAEQRQAHADNGDGLGGCTMMTALAPPDRRPVVLIRFDKTYRQAAGPDGDSVDLIANLLLSAGWHLVTQWEADPAEVPGWRLHWHPTTTETTGPATVSITTPGDELLADATLSAAEAWLQAAADRGYVTVCYTPLPLHTWTGVDNDALTEAIREGRVIGGRLAVSIRRRG